jgi:hypothetical protein
VIVGHFDHLTRCGDLTTVDLNAACKSHGTFEELLRHMQQISAPDNGAASILLVLGALASSACDWVDGDLAIELADQNGVTEVAIMMELGMGMRERLFPPIRLRAPLSELTLALDEMPSLIGALKVSRRATKRITFGVSQPARMSSLPPRISDESLFVVRKSMQLQAVVVPPIAPPKMPVEPPPAAPTPRPAVIVPAARPIARPAAPGPAAPIPRPARVPTARLPLPADKVPREESAEKSPGTGDAWDTLDLDEPGS